MNDRPDDALKVLHTLHSDLTEEGEKFVRAEFYQVKEQVALDLKLPASWRDIVTRPSYRKRAIFTMGFAFLSQSCGPLVINNYVCYQLVTKVSCINGDVQGPTIYKSLGFGTVEQLGLACGWITRKYSLRCIEASTKRISWYCC